MQDGLLLVGECQEFLALVRLDHVLVERAVHLGPALERLHRRHPAGDVRVLVEAAADRFGAEAHDRAHVVGDRDLVAADELVLAEDRLVQDLEPALRFPQPYSIVPACTRSSERFMKGKVCGIDVAVREIAIEAGVEPVHALVHAGALLRVGRVGR
jgi:hypothetical protein